MLRVVLFLFIITHLYGVNIPPSLAKKISYQGYKWGLIDKKGNWIIEPNFDVLSNLF